MSERPNPLNAAIVTAATPQVGSHDNSYHGETCYHPDCVAAREQSRAITVAANDPPVSVRSSACERRTALSQNLTRLMEAKRMSFRDLSHATGLSTTGLFKIVDGQSDPTLGTLWKIIDCFGITLDAPCYSPHREHP